MLKQWNWRKGLEDIKIKHSMVHNNSDQQLRKEQKNEIQSYLAWVRKQQDKEYLKDVFITDNKLKTPKYNVTNTKDLD